MWVARRKEESERKWNKKRKNVQEIKKKVIALVSERKKKKKKKKKWKKKRSYYNKIKTCNMEVKKMKEIIEKVMMEVDLKCFEQDFLCKGKFFLNQFLVNIKRKLIALIENK